MQVENQNRRLAVLARIIHEDFYLPASVLSQPGTQTGERALVRWPLPS